MCDCDVTVSTDALHALLGFFPVEMYRDFSALARWQKSVDDVGLDSESVDIWKLHFKRQYLRRIPWTLDLIPKTTCSYYTDGSKLSLHILVVVEGQTMVENQFWLADSLEVLAADAHAINEAFLDAHRKGPSELDIYRNSRSALQALNSHCLNATQMPT